MSANGKDVVLGFKKEKGRRGGARRDRREKALWVYINQIENEFRNADTGTTSESVSCILYALQYKCAIIHLGKSTLSSAQAIQP